MYYCTVRQVSHNTVLVPLWLSNTLPPFPDLYFPVGQSTANPKSLPASPWRRASVEQMASVCRAAIKEGATSGEKKVGQDQGGAGPATWSCLCLGPAHGRMHLHTQRRTHTHMHAHRCVCSYLSALLPGSSQQKQTPTPRQSWSVSSVRMKRGVRAVGEVWRTTNCPQISHSESLRRWEVRDTSARITRANPTTQSIGLTL